MAIEGLIDKYGLPLNTNHDRNDSTDRTKNNSISLIY